MTVAAADVCYTPSVRLFLSFAVTLSFLAGQACGGGVGIFLPQQISEGEEGLMSMMVVRCMMNDGDVVTVPGTDCGPGQCVENIKDDPSDASATVARPDISCPPAPQAVMQERSGLISFHRTDVLVSASGRPLTVVRLQ